MALVDSFVLTVCAAALACCILHPTLVFGSNHIQARSSSTASCTCETATTMLTCTAQPTGCDADEMPYGDSCYRFLRDNRKNRKAAHRDCIARNGHLVYIESEDEQNFLAFYESFFYQDGSGNDERYWIGLIATSNYIWLDGSPLHRDLSTFVDNTQLGCIFVQEGDSHQIVSEVGNCGTARRFICEFPPLTADVCQDEERASGESCYIFFDSPKTQSEAQATCQTLAGGHLLYIETEDEVTFIESLLGDTGQSEYWIGLMTQYVWLDGSNATYQAYDSESHNSRGQCFRMYPGSDFKWNDRSCGTKYAYVCERELTAPEMQDVSGMH
ncbi:macrophage mannose receptor 1-like [Patiria miniata]|uniref:C-type lectin domain-containing protein n=1 Tax=Patiria miniata TaxID=46514 RepID=A0A914AL27_PATMI|nr:macrophage mannose receptor 1-like [Patiria miniata]